MQNCEIDPAITLSLEGKVECQAQDLSLQMTNQTFQTFSISDFSISLFRQWKANATGSSF